MTTPGVVLGTLVLNEMQWLPKLWAQHKDWPGLRRWVFVEAADRVYAECNPGMVSARGLSTDGTSELLEQLEHNDDRVTYIPHGFTGHPDPAQGKCAARQRYLDVAESIKPDYLVILDADEFWPAECQESVLHLMHRTNLASGFVFRHREIWHPPSIQGNSAFPLFGMEVTGGFWSIPYCRCWRWTPGLRYSLNHNTPDSGGYLLDRNLRYFNRDPDSACRPQFVHMGFTSEDSSRSAKHRYYASRGEARDRKRAWYVESRARYHTWQPQDGPDLPRGARVVPYQGPVPEVFQGKEAV